MFTEADNHLLTLTPKIASYGAEFLRECSPPSMWYMSNVTCLVSYITCHKSHVMCQVSRVIFFFYKVVEVVGGDFGTNRAHSSIF